MRATQILMVDHEEADTMMNTLASGDMGPNDAALFGRLKESLQLHSLLEEEIFYPALKGFSETKQLIEDSYVEHKEVDKLLAEMSPGNSSWDEQILELRQKVKRHAEKEERELFPKAEQLLGDEELLRMGTKMQGIKAGRTPVPAAGAASG
jgi:hemerythrin superfamily protein